MAEMMNLPICPGCGGKMKLEFWTDCSKLPVINPEKWCCFKCECGWQSPNEYADTAHEAFEKAYHAAMKRQAEKPPKAPEELTRKEMAEAIENYCVGRSCYTCELFHKVGNSGCFSEDSDVKRNYIILKEAGCFDQKAGEAWYGGMKNE